MVDALDIISVSTVIFGIASLLLISRARSRLSNGSIRNYLGSFEICLSFIIIFSVWQTIRGLLDISIQVENFISYPEYIFLIFAYIAFVIASFRVLKISDEFGFNDYGKKINKIISEKPAHASQAAENKKNKKFQPKKNKRAKIS